MPTSRPFAYNPLHLNLSGTTNVGDLCIGVSSANNYKNNYGGLIWWKGPNEDLGYVIAVPNSGNTQPTPYSGITASVGFWGTEIFPNPLTDTTFINLVNGTFNQTFTGATQASNWLTTNGYWNSYIVPTPTPTTTITPTPTPSITQTITPTNTPTPTTTPTNTLTPTTTPTNTPTLTPTPDFVRTGLIIQLEADNSISYPGVGTTVFDLTTNSYNHTLTDGASFTTLNGIKCFDCTSNLERVVVNGTGPTLPTSGYTYITWARVEAGNPLSFRTLLYTNSPKYTPITIPDGTNTLGYWDTEFRSSGYDLSSSVGVWVQYAIVGDSSSQTFYINGSQVGSPISFGSGGRTHWGWGNNNVPQPWGYIANLYLYNRKLSLSEISQQYNFLAPRFIEQTPTPTMTQTPTQTPTMTQTPTPTPTTTPTNTPTLTPTKTLTPTPTVTLSSGIITDSLFMKLDATNYTSGVWLDETVNGNNATINGATWSSTDGGIFDLNGTSNTISIPHTSNLSLNTTTQRTIQVWVKFDVLPALNVQIPVFGKLSSSYGFDGYWGGLFSNGGKVRSVTNGTGVQRIVDSTLTVTTNTWYLFTFISQITSTANTTKVYINTTEYITTAHGTDGYSESNPLYLGYIGTGISSTYLNGKIGACYFYTKGLNSTEITNNYNVTKSRFGL